MIEWLKWAVKIVSHSEPKTLAKEYPYNLSYHERLEEIFRLRAKLDKHREALEFIQGELLSYWFIDTACDQKVKHSQKIFDSLVKCGKRARQSLIP